MKYAILLLPVLVLFSCTGQNFPKKDLNYYEVEGKVNHLSIYHYLALEKDGEIVKGEPYLEGEGDQTLTFNKQGYAIEVYFYGEADSLDSKLIRDHDKDFKCLGEAGFNAKNEPIFEWIWLYDDKGNNTERIQVQEDSSLFTSWYLYYDESGELIARTVFRSPNSNLFDSLRWTLDDKKRQVEEWNYGYYGLYGYNKVEYIGETDKIAKIYRYDYLEDLTDYFELSYNDHDLLADAKQFNADSLEQQVLNFEYTYDEKGNWITKIQFKEGNPVYLDERRIIYY